MTKPIVADTDGSEESLRAVEWAAIEAGCTGSAADRVRRVAAPDHRAPGPARPRRRRRRIASTATSPRHAPARVPIRPRTAIATDALADQPAQAVTGSGSGALMLVVGSRGLGAFAAMVLGSVSRYTADYASCPVAVVRDDTATVHRQVGVGIGDLDSCADSLTFAFEEASLRKASLIAIHAWHTPQTDISRAGSPSPVPGSYAIEAEAAGQLAGLLDSWRKKYPDVPVSQDVVHGHPGRALVGLSASSDLLVIGRHVKHPSLQGPGSVRHAVLNYALGPIAVVPSS